MKTFCEGPEIVLPKHEENAIWRANHKAFAEILLELSTLHGSNLSAFFHSSQHQNH
jgi:hypothetical protein